MKEASSLFLSQRGPTVVFVWLNQTFTLIFIRSMVRLITHNLLACHVKGCTSNNFPLEFKDVQIELRDAEFNPEFLKGFMPKIEWKALVDAARQVE